MTSVISTKTETGSMEGGMKEVGRSKTGREEMGFSIGGI